MTMAVDDPHIRVPANYRSQDVEGLHVQPPEPCGSSVGHEGAVFFHATPGTEVQHFSYLSDREPWRWHISDLL
jgi:hypothetical protein